MELLADCTVSGTERQTASIKETTNTSFVLFIILESRNQDVPFLRTDSASF